MQDVSFRQERWLCPPRDLDSSVRTLGRKKPCGSLRYIPADFIQRGPFASGRPHLRLKRLQKVWPRKSAEWEGQRHQAILLTVSKLG